MPALGAVFGALSAAAGVISALRNIFDDPHEKLDEKLNEILTQLQGLTRDLVRATAEILQAIDGIRRQINEDVALDAMALADRALFSDLAILNNKEEALGNSFLAADRLFREDDVVFAGPFMYVVNIRLAVLKDFDPNYFFNRQFEQEFRNYIDHLNVWIAFINDLIAQANIAVEAVDVLEISPTGVELGSHLEALYIHNGAVAETFRGRRNDLSEATARRLTQAANNARARGIENDRRESGVIDIEKTAEAWFRAFVIEVRLALVTQVLKRRATAIDFNPEGLMVDGRLLPADLDLRSTVLELLLSNELRSQADKVIDDFVKNGEDKLVRFVHQRIHDRDATQDEINSLRRIASNTGFGGFITALLNSKDERKGRVLHEDPQDQIAA